MTGERLPDVEPSGEEAVVERYLRSRAAVDLPAGLNASIGSALRVQPARQPLVMRLRWIGTAAALVLVVVLAATVMSLPRGPGDRTPEGSPSRHPSSAPEAPFPSEVHGLRVRSVGQAIEARDSGELDGKAVAIAGYFSWDQRSYFTCAPPEDEPGELELYCFEGQWSLSEQDESIVRPDQGDPSFRFPLRGPTLTPHLPPLLTSAQGWPEDEAFAVGRRAAPMVFIGHFGDPRASLCRPIAGEICEERFVVDKLSWIAGEYVALVAITEHGERLSTQVMEEAWQSTLAALTPSGLVLSLTDLPARELAAERPGLHLKDSPARVWYATAVEDVGGENRYAVLILDPGSGDLLARAPARTVLGSPTPPGAPSTPQPSPPPSPTSPPPAWTFPAEPTVLPEGTEPSTYLSDAERLAIASDIVTRLESFYSAQTPTLEEIFTPAALPHALEMDPFLAGVAEGRLMRRRDVSVVWIQEHNASYLPDGTVVRVDWELLLQAESGALVLGRSTNQVIERNDAPTRFAIAFQAVYDAANERWLINAWRTPRHDFNTAIPRGPITSGDPCPWTVEEPPRSDDFAPAHAWCDAGGRDVSKDYVSFIRGHDHCGWESVLFLTVGWPIGTEIDRYQPHQYVRDPERVLRDWPVAPFDPNAQQPADAVSTGITNGRVTLWTSASEGADAIYVVGDSFVERWPRAEQVVACR